MRLIECVLALACCVGLHAQSQPEPKPDIAGVTVDSKGGPLRKTELMLMSLAKNAVGDPMPSYSAVSEGDGKFEFYGIPPGRYRLLADHAGYLRTRYGAKTPWGSGAVLTLQQGVPLTGLEIRMPEQAVISGNVQYDGPAGSLMLGLAQEKYQDGRRQMSVVSSATVELSGEFRFNRLAPGRYYLVARPATASGADPGIDDEINVTTYYPGKPDQSAAEPIALKGGQSVSADFSVLKAQRLRVSGSVGVLPPNASRIAVSMRATGESVAPFSSSATVEPDGTFQFNSVPPGSYLLTATVPGGTTPRVLQQQINVQGDLAGVFLKAEQSSVLQGSVRVEGGTGAAPNLRLALEQTTPPFQGQLVRMANDGTFTFGPAPPGRYRYLFLQFPTGAYLKSAKFGDKDALPEVDLTQPSDARLELVISYAGAQIEGVILDEQGKPADGIASLIPDPPQPAQPSLYQTAESGEGGQFRFQSVRPGKYRVYAWEELEPGSHMDPRVTAPREAYSVAIEVAENDKKKIAVKRIPVETAPVAGGQ